MGVDMRVCNHFPTREERIVEEELNLRVAFGAELKKGMVQQKLVDRMVGGYLRDRRRRRPGGGFLGRGARIGSGG
jgi:hypothetical protein